MIAFSYNGAIVFGVDADAVMSMIREDIVPPVHRPLTEHEVAILYNVLTQAGVPKDEKEKS